MTTSEKDGAMSVVERDNPLQRGQQFIIRIRRDIQHFIISFNCSSRTTTIAFPYAKINRIYLKNIWYSGHASIRKSIVSKMLLLFILLQLFSFVLFAVPGDLNEYSVMYFSFCS